MHMRYIESLITLYNEGNISKASKKLFLTQQGLSRQIQTIEKELDAILFKRSKIGVVPTDICVKLYPYFTEMHNNYSIVKELTIEYSSEKENPIVIAFASGISNGLSTGVILDFQKDYPHIQFNFKEWTKDKCIDKLAHNEADIAFLVNPFDLNQFDSHLLAEGYMYVAIHNEHPLALQKTINFQQLDGENIVTGSEDNALRELFDHYCQLSKIKPNVIFSSSYSLDIINSNTDSMLMATVTPIMVSKITNPNMKIIRLVTPVPGYLYCCTSRNKNKSKDLLCFIDYIKVYFDDVSIIKIH